MKNKLLAVFGNFDKEILKTVTTAYSVRGTYEMNRESFDNYVRKKTEQINKIVKEFEGPKMSPTKIIPSNDKLKEPLKNQTIKVKIYEK